MLLIGLTIADLSMMVQMQDEATINPVFFVSSGIKLLTFVRFFLIFLRSKF